MKNLVFIMCVFAILFGTESYGQYSVGGGISLPIGSFADDDGGSAGIGFNIKGGWDNMINENVGIATGILIGMNPVSENENFVDAGSYSYLALEAGLLVQAGENGKIRAMIVRAGASTPEITSGSQVLLSSATAGAFGFDIGFTYEFDQIYVGINYLSFTPEFQYNFGSLGTFKDKQNFGVLQFGGGFIF